MKLQVYFYNEKIKDAFVKYLKTEWKNSERVKLTNVCGYGADYLVCVTVKGTTERFLLDMEIDRLYEEYSEEVPLEERI